ncbi:SRPBCC family protein [bacterium]|nr:SRPBCC family protein [bacterium]
MKKIIIGIVAVLVVCSLVFVGVASTQPTDFEIVESIEMKASQAVVFAQINELKNWRNWSPWLKKDPQTELEFSDKTAGMDAWYSWKSQKFGEGKMTITDVVREEAFKMKLQFIAPMSGEAKAYFKIKPISDSTQQVFWRFEGKNNSLSEKFFFKIFSIQKSISEDLKEGLQNLKTLVESTPATAQ